MDVDTQEVNAIVQFISENKNRLPPFDGDSPVSDVVIGMLRSMTERTCYSCSHWGKKHDEEPCSVCRGWEPHAKNWENDTREYGNGLDEDLDDDNAFWLGWVEWNGGRCPIPEDARVLILTRIGSVSGIACPASSIDWGLRAIKAFMIDGHFWITTTDEMRIEIADMIKKAGLKPLAQG